MTKKLGLSRSSRLDIFHSGVDRTKKEEKKNRIKEVISEFTAILKAEQRTMILMNWKERNSPMEW